MPDIRVTTCLAIEDALALRGLDGEGKGLIRTASPETYMSAERLRVARAVLRHLPRTVPTTSMASLIDRLVPVVSRMAEASHINTALPGPAMFLS